MPAEIVVASVERPVLGFALDRVATFLGKGTSEQREIAVSLEQMREGLDATPDGAIEVEFLEQDIYLLGIRFYHTSVELEEFWLVAKEPDAGDPERESDPELRAAIVRYFPDLLEQPSNWDFEAVRGVFTDLGIKIDRAVTDLAPRARAMYNSDREEMTDRAIAIHEAAIRRRAAWTEAAYAAQRDAAVAVADRAMPAAPQWGVEFSTALTPDDIPLESFRAVTVGSVRVLITNYGGTLRAIDGTCSHQHAQLSAGGVEGTVIECGRHGARFDLRSGEQLCPPFCPMWLERHGAIGSFLKIVTPNKKGGDLHRYPLRVENGEIILRV
jgi:nitrite reductase/ring-hydroxylating ferredoxin subunit